MRSASQLVSHSGHQRCGLRLRRRSSVHCMRGFAWRLHSARECVSVHKEDDEIGGEDPSYICTHRGEGGRSDLNIVVLPVISSFGRCAIVQGCIVHSLQQICIECTVELVRHRLRLSIGLIVSDTMVGVHGVGTAWLQRQRGAT